MSRHRQPGQLDEFQLLGFQKNADGNYDHVTPLQFFAAYETLKQLFHADKFAANKAKFDKSNWYRLQETFVKPANEAIKDTHCIYLYPIKSSEANGTLLDGDLHEQAEPCDLLEFAIKHPNGDIQRITLIPSDLPNSTFENILRSLTSGQSLTVEDQNALYSVLANKKSYHPVIPEIQYYPEPYIPKKQADAQTLFKMVTDAYIKILSLEWFKKNDIQRPKAKNVFVDKYIKYLVGAELSQVALIVMRTLALNKPFFLKEGYEKTIPLIECLKTINSSDVAKALNKVNLLSDLQLYIISVFENENPSIMTFLKITETLIRYHHPSCSYIVLTALKEIINENSRNLLHLVDNILTSNLLKLLENSEIVAQIIKMKIPLVAFKKLEEDFKRQLPKLLTSEAPDVMLPAAAFADAAPQAEHDAAAKRLLFNLQLLMAYGLFNPILLSDEKIDTIDKIVWPYLCNDSIRNYLILRHLSVEDFATQLKENKHLPSEDFKSTYAKLEKANDPAGNAILVLNVRGIVDQKDEKGFDAKMPVEGNERRWALVRDAAFVKDDQKTAMTETFDDYKPELFTNAEAAGIQFTDAQKIRLFLCTTAETRITLQELNPTFDSASSTRKIDSLTQLKWQLILEALQDYETRKLATWANLKEQINYILMLFKSTPHAAPINGELGNEVMSYVNEVAVRLRLLEQEAAHCDQLAASGTPSMPVTPKADIKAAAPLAPTAAAVDQRVVATVAEAQQPAANPAPALPVAGANAVEIKIAAAPQPLLSRKSSGSSQPTNFYGRAAAAIRNDAAKVRGIMKSHLREAAYLHRTEGKFTPLQTVRAGMWHKVVGHMEKIKQSSHYDWANPGRLFLIPVGAIIAAIISIPLIANGAYCEYKNRKHTGESKKSWWASYKDTFFRPHRAAALSQTTREIRSLPVEAGGITPKAGGG